MEAGYLGVGNMGQPMAQKLLDAGHSLTIYDINEAAMRPLLERQARRAASPKDLADRCEIVFVSLPTLGAFREVVFGADGLAKGRTIKLLINTCTVGVPFVKEIEQEMATQGVTVVDCPISGGPAGAREGTLYDMVSGDPAAIEKRKSRILGISAEVKAETRGLSRRAWRDTRSNGNLDNPVLLAEEIEVVPYLVSSVRQTIRCGGNMVGDLKLVDLRSGGLSKFCISRIAPARETAGSRPSDNRPRYGYREIPPNDARSRVRSAVVRTGGRRRAD
jgi:hypothetical protein